MLSRFPAILVALSLAVAVVPSSADAECVRLTPKRLLNQPDTQLAFVGKVVEVTRTSDEGARVTFEVERVWKGDVPKRIDIYTWYPNPEAPRYDQKGSSYVVAAKPLVEERAREGVGLRDSDAVVFAGLTCSEGFTVQDFVRAAGPGKPPAGEKADRRIRR